MKPFSPARHTVVDVLFCIATACAPSVLGFGGLPAIVCYWIAGGYFVFSMLTNTPLAPLRVIPFRVHRGVEIVAGLGLIALPWLLRFQENDRAKWFFVGAGIVTFIVFALTDWREEPKRMKAEVHPA